MSEKKLSLSIELTALLVQDKKTGYFSVFFAQFPEAIAFGRDENEAERNLYDLFSVMLRDREKEMMLRVGKQEDYKSKQINLATA